MSIFFDLRENALVFLNGLLKSSDLLTRPLGVFEKLSSFVKLATKRLILLFEVLRGF